MRQRELEVTQLHTYKKQNIQYDAKIHFHRYYNRFNENST